MPRGLILALQVPNDVRARCIELSQQLSRAYPTHFTLGKDGYYTPHVTIYAGKFREGVEQAIAHEVMEATRGISSISCLAIAVANWRGYVGIEILPNEELLDLRDKIFQKLIRWQEIQHKDRAPYFPHLTLTRLQNEADSAAATQSITWDTREFSTQSIGLFVSGLHGTCMEPLRRCMLG